MKGHVLAPALDEYIKRLRGRLTITELTGKNTKDEHQKILEKITPNAPVIVLDETGKTLSSRDFSARIKTYQNDGVSTLQFIIGGADGVSDEIRERANLCLSFGAQTWPHMMVRVMLAEQIYRAEQILSGHPYHRD